MVIPIRIMAGGGKLRRGRRCHPAERPPLGYVREQHTLSTT